MKCEYYPGTIKPFSAVITNYFTVKARMFVTSSLVKYLKARLEPTRIELLTGLRSISHVRKYHTRLEVSNRT
jgi:hypothetical protein